MCAAVVQRYYFLSVVRQFEVAQGILVEFDGNL